MNLKTRLARFVLMLFLGAGMLALLGADGVQPLAPGTKVESTLSSAILILRNLGAGPALRADNTSTGAAVLAYGRSGYGVHGMTDATDKAAVFGVSVSSVGVSGHSDKSDGVLGFTGASGKSGVWGRSTSGVGVTGSSGESDGVVGWTDSAQKSGVYGRSTNGIGVTAASSAGTALYVDGTSTFKRYATFEGGHGDVAENYRAGEPLEAGDVVVISRDGGLALVRSRVANDTAVVGVVAGEPSLRLAGGIPDAEGVPLAIAGRVRCKVDAGYGAIAPGDLLTASPSPGYAMKAIPVQVSGVELYRPGSLIGKALEPCDAGLGLIEVLVTLH
ncbi:MAG: hypothetical protein PHW86_04090 [Candidatus Bipolaricaulis sp.]|nr:hypothetical protein [Candidatus Bipolaricaulis sp.]